MATLPTILVNGNGTSPRDWASQSYLDIDEGIPSADANFIAALDDVDLNQTSFTLDNMPADFDTMSSLSWQVRYRQQGRVDDTYGLQLRIMSGGTVLAAFDSGGTFQTVNNNITNTAFQNSSVTAFTYVNTTAGKAAWDAATLEFSQRYVQNMAKDAGRVQVDGVQFTGTYAQVAADDSMMFFWSVF